MSATKDGGPAFPIVAEDNIDTVFERGMSLRQYAAITLRVPESGLPWLDQMIERARRDDLAALTTHAEFLSDSLPGPACDAMVRSAAKAGIEPEQQIARNAYVMADAVLEESAKGGVE